MSFPSACACHAPLQDFGVAKNGARINTTPCGFKRWAICGVRTAPGLAQKLRTAARLVSLHPSICIQRLVKSA